MKKVFFALLFLSIAGAGVLVWLIRAAPSSPKPVPEPQGLTIIDEKHEEVGKAAGHGGETQEVEAEEPRAVAEHAPAAEGKAVKADEAEHKEPAEHADKTHSEGTAADPAPVLVKHESKHEVVVSALTVRTEPPGAQVRVDGELRGHTPYELALTDKEQKVEVEAEGFEPFTRTAPAAKAAGNGQLGWKVQLKSKPEAKAAHEHAEEPAHAAAPLKKAHKAVDKVDMKKAVVPPPSANEIVHVGPLGPYVIQFKSIERTAGSEAAVKEAIEKLRTELHAISVGDVIVGCSVDLGAKGRWVRLVTGPFVNKQAAVSRLAHYKNVVSDAYIAGTQKCQP